MSAFQKYLQALIGAEASIFPLFFHSQSGQKLAALIIGAESAVLGTVQAVASASQATTDPPPGPPGPPHAE